MVLTARQQEIWQFLVEYVDGHGYPPTVREIGESVGLASPSTVHAHLANLERAGLIRRDPTKPRAIELVGQRRVQAPAPREEPAPRLPLLGRIAAGAPLLAAEQVEDEIAVPEPLGRGADFLLTVHGDSMVEAGILGVVAVVVGVVAGLGVGALLIVTAGGSARGVPFELPWPTLVLAVVLGVGLAMVAAAWPARIASRIAIAQAVRSE